MASRFSFLGVFFECGSSYKKVCQELSSRLKAYISAWVVLVATEPLLSREGNESAVGFKYAMMGVSYGRCI